MLSAGHCRYRCCQLQELLSLRVRVLLLLLLSGMLPALVLLLPTRSSGGCCCDAWLQRCTCCTCCGICLTGW
jgi:hypothetical protein